MGKEEAGRDCSESKSTGEKHEFRVVTASHGLGHRDSRFLVADAGNVFPLQGLHSRLLVLHL